ncbi:hypothetical protein EWI07_08580 [Sporolactobacillus sp. THM7-4]|nr:hypothetical protein EWI07_08580 [Sporolactobacillus sp. THM7-4]
MMNELFEFMTFAFPKAGAQIGVPLTIAMLLFLLALLKCQYQVIPAFLQVRGLSTSYIIFVFFVLISFIFNLGAISSFQLTAAMVVVGSPLAIGIGNRIDPQKAMLIIAVALMIVGAYAFVQRVIGIVSTSIPGLTYTFGQDLAAKPIGYGMAASGEAQKMPSTYQNGNGAGLFYALAIPLLLSWIPQTSRQNRIRISGVVLGIVGLLLSGSRSIIIPFALLFVFLLILLKNKLNFRQQMLFLSTVLLGTFMLILYLMYTHNPFLSQLYARYIEQTVSDPTGADRTVQYSSAFSAVNAMDGLGFIRFLLIGMPWEQIEGIEGLISTLFMYGLFGFLGFVSLLLSTMIGVFKVNKLNAIGFICVFVAFMVDGSFNFPPALMNFFFLAGLLTRPDARKTSEHWLNEPLQWGMDLARWKKVNKWKLQ